MWRIGSTRVDDGTIRWSLLDEAGRALAFDQVARSWRTDEAFRQFWIDSLRGVSFGAYCWECPPVDDLRRNRGFECVFVSNPSLARSIEHRFPYLDPLNHLQVELMRRYRQSKDGDPAMERVKRGIHISINGVAAGLRNTG